jgi:hypothetical protein
MFDGCPISGARSISGTGRSAVAEVPPETVVRFHGVAGKTAGLTIGGFIKIEVGEE